MAERFFKEATARKQEIDTASVPRYIVDILEKIDKLDIKIDKLRTSEDCLMYSTLLENFAR